MTRPKVRLQYGLPAEVTLNARIAVPEGVSDEEAVDEILQSLDAQRRTLGRAAVTLTLQVQPSRLAQPVAREVRRRMSGQFCTVTVC